MTHGEAIDALVSTGKEFGIEHWPKHREMGLRSMENVEAKWELRIWNINDRGEKDGVKWDYEGETLQDCVKQAAKYEHMMQLPKEEAND